MNPINKRLKYDTVYPAINSISKLLGLRSVSEDQGSSNVFIVTAGRSGSTLLAGLLNNFEEIHFAPEQSVLWFSINRFYGLPMESWRSFCISILEKFLYTHPDWNLTNEQIGQLIEQLTHLSPREHTVNTLIRSVYECHGALHSKRPTFIGDQTPLSAMLFRTVYPEYAEARYIFLVRHPLDVVSSYLSNKELGYSDLEKACWRWLSAVKAYQSLRNQGRFVYLLRYEDLVSKPLEVIPEIAKFIGMNQRIVESQLDALRVNSTILGVEQSRFHQFLKHPISTDRIDGWKSSLRPDDIRIIRQRVSSIAIKFNYYI